MTTQKVAVFTIFALVLPFHYAVHALAKNLCGENTYKAEKLIDRGEWKKAFPLAHSFAT